MNKGFEDALGFVLSWEGGYVDDPDDAGGETNFGISKKAFPELDIRNLTKEKAAAIYKSEYWDKCRCSDMPWKVAMVVFDEAVNQGVRAASQDLQAACGAHTDGIIGPNTLGTLSEVCQKISVEEMVKKVTKMRMARYKATIARRPESQVFMRGWMRRAFACLQKALEI